MFKNLIKLILLVAVIFAVYKLATGVKTEAFEINQPGALLIVIVLSGALLGAITFGVWHLFSLRKQKGIKKAMPDEIVCFGIAMSLIVLGLWILIRDLRTLASFSYNFSQVINQLGLLTFVLFPVIPLFFIIGAIAFLFLKKWGQVLIQISLILDISLRIFVIIGFQTFWFFSSTS